MVTSDQRIPPSIIVLSKRQQYTDQIVSNLQIFLKMYIITFIYSSKLQKKTKINYIYKKLFIRQSVF